MSILLNAKNIQKNFSHKNKTLPILKKISLTLNFQEIIVITGPSGSGKSTLLHILGLMDPSFQCDTYTFNGIDIKTQSQSQKEKLRKINIGFVFQQFHLFPEWTVFDNIALSLFFCQPHLPTNEIRQQVHKIAQQTQLDNRIEHEVYRLSGGEQQRVSIARALIKSPQIILCDEPTGNLDKKTGKTILNLLKVYTDNHKSSLVIVTHNQGDIHFKHTLLHLNEGQLTKQY